MMSYIRLAIEITPEMMLFMIHSYHSLSFIIHIVERKTVQIAVRLSHFFINYHLLAIQINLVSFIQFNLNKKNIFALHRKDVNFSVSKE